MVANIELFDIYIFLVTLFKGVGAEASDKLYILAFFVGALAIFLKLVKEKFSKNELKKVLFILIIGGLDFILGKSTMFLFTAIALAGLKNVNENRIINIVFWTRLFSFLLMIFLSTLGFIQDKIYLFYRDNHFISRHTFGYGHPNQTQSVLTILIILAIYLFNKKFNIIHYSVMFIVNYCLYSFTFSRTGFFIGVLCIILGVVQKNDKLGEIFARLFKNSYFWAVAVTLFIGLFYNVIPQLKTLDTFFTGRLAYNNTLLTNFVPPLIGSSKYNEYVNIDNGFISLMYQGGILAFCWISYYIIKLMENFYKQKKFKELFFLTSFIIYGMTESFFPNIAVNISLIFIGRLMFENKNDKGFENV